MLPLRIAVSLNDKNMVQLLLERGAEVDKLDDNQQTAALCLLNPEITSLLLEQGANPNQQDIEELTPL